MVKQYPKANEFTLIHCLHCVHLIFFRDRYTANFYKSYIRMELLIPKRKPQPERIIGYMCPKHLTCVCDKDVRFQARMSKENPTYLKSLNQSKNFDSSQNGKQTQSTQIHSQVTDRKVVKPFEMLTHIAGPLSFSHLTVVFAA